MSSMIEIQDRLAEKLNRAAIRWGIASHHAKPSYLQPGHYSRSRRAAVKEARQALAELGFGATDAKIIIRDAIDAAELELRAQ